MCLKVISVQLTVVLVVQGFKITHCSSLLHPRGRGTPLYAGVRSESFLVVILNPCTTRFLLFVIVLTYLSLSILPLAVHVLLIYMSGDG